MMYDTEVMKPSNTGKLIADVLPDTLAFYGHVPSLKKPYLMQLMIRIDKLMSSSQTAMLLLREKFITSYLQTVSHRYLSY